MEVFSPLIESAAWWIQVDAFIRILWHVVGILFSSALTIWVIAFFIKTIFGDK